MSGVVGWIVFVAVWVVIVAIAWAVFRSLRKWKAPPPTTPEAKQADARLWSTKSMDQR